MRSGVSDVGAFRCPWPCVRFPPPAPGNRARKSDPGARIGEGFGAERLIERAEGAAGHDGPPDTRLGNRDRGAMICRATRRWFLPPGRCPRPGWPPGISGPGGREEEGASVSGGGLGGLSRPGSVAIRRRAGCNRPERRGQRFGRRARRTVGRLRAIRHCRQTMAPAPDRADCQPDKQYAMLLGSPAVGRACCGSLGGPWRIATRFC